MDKFEQSIKEAASEHEPSAHFVDTVMDTVSQPKTWLVCLADSGQQCRDSGRYCGSDATWYYAEDGRTGYSPRPRQTLPPSTAPQ